ncbi:MAG: polysaccharide deacetylase family protein [Pseudomonadales bacterium]|nr:polysaccharide deacetylase family protein [Pseudomonadales bacterium]
MSSWQALSEEINQWPMSVQFWWRDDDAVADSEPLQKMLQLAKSYDIAVHLAVIPNLLETSLDVVKHSDNQPFCYVLQHGVEHKNFALQGQRKIELGGSQDLLALQQNLGAGQRLLQQTFVDQYLSILVPPWNRIAEELIPCLDNMGYQKLSVLGKAKLAETKLHLNVHIDIINWRERQFAGEQLILRTITEHLRHKRLSGNSPKPCGLMTHHLDHDQDCWNFLDKFFSFCRDHSKVQWVAGNSLYQY